MEPLAGPLRILAAVGAPDEEVAGGAVLDHEAEVQTILDAIAEARMYGSAGATILEVGHHEEIQKALEARSYHVLHISGHGRAGVIEMENEDGRAVSMTPDDLAEAIRASGRRVPLIFMASCHGGASASDAAGFAQAMLQAGAPLVLAMQTSVSDWYATRLAGKFYTHISRMETPLASQALALARQEVERERRAAVARGESAFRLQPEYATPSLFITGQEAPLVDFSLPVEPIRCETAPPAGGVVPLLAVGDLIGRRKELRHIIRVLENDPGTVKKIGAKAGCLILGIGGVGKSTLAGRVMQRMKDRNWLIAAVAGKWTLAELSTTVGGALLASDNTDLNPLTTALLKGDLPDQARLQVLAHLLGGFRLLLVLDNFEDNLEPAGAGFLDPTMEKILALLYQSANQGKIIITTRHPAPGSDPWLAPLHLGPLSPAQTRKLFLRLPALEEKDPATLTMIHRCIGGHPRVLEYLDALLRKGAARLPRVAVLFREMADKAGITKAEMGRDTEASIRQALLLGAEDILLSQLLEIIGHREKDLALLHQASVFTLPVDAAGLALAMHWPDPPGKNDVSTIEKQLLLLIETSLLTPLDEGMLWVHRWTGESLKCRMDETVHQNCCKRAGEYRAWRVSNISHSLTDGLEGVRHFLDGKAFDRAAEEAIVILDFLEKSGQSSVIASLAEEVAGALPEEHEVYIIILDREANALISLGFVQDALKRLQKLQSILESQIEKEPGQIYFQRSLSVSYNKMADVLIALGQGEEALQYYTKAMEIAERLAGEEPERSNYQRDLSVSYERMGDVSVALGNSGYALQYHKKRMEIAERLAGEEPERSNYQR
ncbi:MAG: CHAT domain-containing protein, partial [Desulfobacterales bacterium]|nr:CHAT domain-containing protein [Desulfobacterales bacterium]